MSFTSSNAAKTYAKTGMETGVATANPHRLILMLLDGAQLAIAKAEDAMQKGRIADKGESISRTIGIIGNGLKASLDYSAGDELSNRLAALYDYMVARLVHANLNNDIAALKEVSHLLSEIKSAWEEIANDPAVASRNKVAA